MRHAAIKSRPSKLGRIILRRTFEAKHAMHQKPRPHLQFAPKEGGNERPNSLN